jgi:phage gpG-like protein
VLTIKVSVDSGRVEHALSTLAERFGDWRPVWRDITDDFHEIEQRRFDEQPWPGWGPLYQQWYRFSSSRILHDTGGLEESLTKGSPLEEGDTTLLLGTRHRATSNSGQSVPVAEILDAGFTARGRMKLTSGRSVDVTGVGVPGRDLIDITPADEERWKGLVEDWVRREIAEVGL